MDSHDEGQHTSSSTDASTLRCSVREAADLLGMSESTIRRRIKHGILPAERDGRQWYVLLPRVLLDSQVHAREVGGGREGSGLALREAAVGAVPIEHASSAAWDNRAVPHPAVDDSAGASVVPPGETILANNTTRVEDDDTQGLKDQRQGGPSVKHEEQVIQERQAEMERSRPRDELENADRTSVAPLRPTRQTPRIGLRQLLAVAVLTLGILGLVDDLVNDDNIPIFAERKVSMNSAPIIAFSPASSRTPQPAPPSPTPTSLGSVVLRPTPTAVQPSLPTPALSLPAPVTPAPPPTTAPPLVERILGRVRSAEATLQTGELEATIDYGEGPASSSLVRFNLGSKEQPPRVHIMTSYLGGSQRHILEYIMIGEDAWQRQPDGDWASVGPQEGVWGQVQAFLPRSERVGALTLGKDGTEVQWHDAERAAEVTLQVDPVTGTPQTMRKVMRATGTVLTVTYHGWNTVVEINVPKT